MGHRRTSDGASIFARRLLACAVLFTATVCAAEPAPGTVVAKANLAEHEALLGPALRWAVGRGLEMEVVAPRSIPLEPARLAATEKYSAQVRLSEDKLRVENFIAGLSFPLVRDEDPDVAVKLMFNPAPAIGTAGCWACARGSPAPSGWSTRSASPQRSAARCPPSGP